MNITEDMSHHEIRAEYRKEVGTLRSRIVSYEIALDKMAEILSMGGTWRERACWEILQELSSGGQQRQLQEGQGIPR